MERPKVGSTTPESGLQRLIRSKQSRSMPKDTIRRVCVQDLPGRGRPTVILITSVRDPARESDRTTSVLMSIYQRPRRMILRPSALLCASHQERIMARLINHCKSNGATNAMTKRTESCCDENTINKCGQAMRSCSARTGTLSCTANLRNRSAHPHGLLR